MEKNNQPKLNSLCNLYVGLGSIKDITRWNCFSGNMKIQEISKPDGLIYFQVTSLKEASELCQKFIRDYDLSSSNWIGGTVLDDNLSFIARVSYNGRVWDNEEFNLSKEIALC